MKTLLTAAGVMGGAFALCFLVAGLAPSAGRMSAVSSLPKPDLIPTVPGTFHKVAPDTRPPEIQEAEADSIEISNTHVTLKFSNIDMSEDDLRASWDDGPRTKQWATYAEMDRAAHNTMVLDGTPADMKAACFSVSRGDGGHPLHMIVKYDATRMFGDDTLALGEWVTTGCAEAVKTNGRLLNPTQFALAFRDTMPDTPQYAEARRKALADLNSKPARD